MDTAPRATSLRRGRLRFGRLAELQKSGVPGDRLHLIPNAWSQRTALLPAREARAQLNVPADVFHVGFVGRLTQEKGPDVLVRALAHLTDVPIVVSFIGSGNERERLEAEARGAGVVDRIRWHGTIPDASRLFAAFDVFVMSSRTEGTPIALFEAIAAAVPVITTAVGGIPDVVSQAEALLVPPRIHKRWAGRSGRCGRMGQVPGRALAARSV
jgi:glycosyltransferase involved in cell wall biosynthesis